MNNLNYFILSYVSTPDHRLDALVDNLFQGLQPETNSMTTSSTRNGTCNSSEYVSEKRSQLRGSSPYAW